MAKIGFGLDTNDAFPAPRFQITSESMIHLGSVVSGKNYFADGFSLKDLGIDYMDRERLLKYLREGF